jgi:hypothetical protein
MKSKDIKKQNSEIVKYNPEQVFKHNVLPANFKHVKTTELALSDTSDSLAKINAKVGIKISLAIIKTWIVNLNDYLNLSRKMSPEQIEETSELIYEQFYYLKSSDISLIFKRIKLGHYGCFYESLDGMKLIDIFYKYAQERINICIDNTERQSNDIKNR